MGKLIGALFGLLLGRGLDEGTLVTLALALGGFVAGMIVRLFMRGHEVPEFESKLKSVGFGFLIPMFFIVSAVSVVPALLLLAWLWKRIGVKNQA